MNDYENMRRIVYGDRVDEFGQAIFVPVCETCGRFVKSDESISLSCDGLSDEQNATCSKCGRTRMLFEGFF
jgi:hypothetical protein